MGFDDGFDQAQTQAKPTLCTAFIRPVKSVPDLALITIQYPDSLILNADHHFIPLAVAPHRHLAA